MKQEIDFTTQPKDYAVCWHPDCPMANDCLRHLASQHLTAERRTVASVNLQAVSPETGACPMQRPVRLVRNAYGMHHIYDQVRSIDKSSIYMKVWVALGNSMYYRYRNGKRPITPYVQDIIAQAFQKFGYNAPVQYDRYEEAMDW